jgi:hypothetical protein
MEGQSGLHPLRVWNTSLSGQILYLVEAWVREAHVVAPRVPWSLRMCVHEFMVTEQ